METPRLQIKDDLLVTDNKLIPHNGTSRGRGKKDMPLSIMMFRNAELWHKWLSKKTLA